MRLTDDPCRIHAPVLAALEEYDELRPDAEALDEARAHLATCARCQARDRAYTRLDATLRATLRAEIAQGAPVFTTADLLAAIGADHEPRERRTPMLSVVTMRDEDDMDDEQQTPSPGEDGESAQPRPAPAASAFAPLPTIKPAPSRQAPWRRALTGLVAVAAVIALVGGIAGAMNLNGRLHGRTGSHSTSAAATATAQAQAQQPAGGPYYHVVALSMDSPTDGFAVVANYADNSGANIILHISDGVATKQSTLHAEYAGSGAMQALSPTNVWLAFLQGGGSNLYHYDGKTWASVSLPAPANAQGNNVTIEGFQMVSPTEGWAIGQYFTNTTDANGFTPLAFAFYRYDGSTWRAEPADKSAANASVGSSIISISGISASANGDVWATGWDSTQDQNGNPTNTMGYIYHRSGGVWRLTQTLHNEQLLGIAMASPSRGWIIGQYSKTTKIEVTIAPYTVTTQNPVAFAWNGARWSTASIPPPTQTQSGMQFSQVIASSPSNAWLLGPSNGNIISADRQYASDTDYLAHFDGARWSMVTLPQIAAINPSNDPTILNMASFTLAATTASGDLWLAGSLSIGTGRGGQTVPLLYHFAGGQWTSVALPEFK